MKSALLRSSLFAAFATLLFVAPLRGSSVIKGVTTTASSWWDDQVGTASYQWVGNLTNNSLMSVPYDVTATHAPNNDAFGMWHAKAWSVDPNPTVTFNLGGAFDLEGMHIWNGNQALNAAHIQRGVKDFQLLISTDGGGNFTLLGTYSLTVSPLPAQAISAQNFDLRGRNGVTHVRIRVLSNHHPSNDDYSSLSEVMFTAASAPETFKLTRFERGAGKVTLAFPSQAGQVFDIYRTTDLVTGFGTPLVAGVAAAEGNTVVDSVIDDFSGGVTLGDSTVNFSTLLTAGTPYVFILDDGGDSGRQVAVVSWSGSTVTLAENVAGDLSWSGPYRIQSAAPAETEWVDTNPPGGRAFYQVRRR